MMHRTIVRAPLSAASLLLVATVPIACASGGGSATPTVAARATSTRATAPPPTPTPPPAPTEAPATAATYSDPLAYCGAVGTVDYPARDRRYTGEAKPARIIEILKAQPIGSYAAPSDYYEFETWRCVEGRVYICASADTCDYADTGEVPNEAMIAFCREHPQAFNIPDYVLGVPVKTVYWWFCDGGAPAIKEQLREVDGRGFLAGSWRPLP